MGRLRPATPLRRAFGHSSSSPHPSLYGPERASQRDAYWLLIILAIALAIRIYGPWSIVFQPTHVNFLDNDGWYHLRIIENLVQQFPHRVTLDPYARPGGQFVPIAPLFDVLVGSAAWMAGLGSPSADRIARVAAFAPPVLGALTILLVYAVARLRGGGLAGLLAATLAAILPGHFLDRTLLGFVDHHALEALLSVGILYLTARGLEPGSPWPRSGIALGLALGAYFLTWTSAAFLAAILAAWLAVHGIVSLWRGVDVGNAARMAGLAAAVAFVVQLVFQHPDSYRYATQRASLDVLALVAIVVELGRTSIRVGRVPARLVVVLVVAMLGAAAAALLVGFPRLAGPVFADLARFIPSPDGMRVLEARPLFLYEGVWSLRPAWLIFRSGFVVGVVGLVAIGAHYVRTGKPVDLLLAVWGVAMYLATLGQNRFGYYLVPLIAVVAGCVSAWAIQGGRRAGRWLRDGSVVAVAALVFGPNLVPAIWTTGRPTGLAADWQPALEWLRDRTPEPFGDAAYYYARYDTEPLRPLSSSVMAWWDYGYWITQAARRVPAANPTQSGASAAASFFLETDEVRARDMLDVARARYVFVDELLPLQLGDASTGSGKFDGMTTWSGPGAARFYNAFLLPQGTAYRAVRLYYPEYYQTMAFRLGVLGGEPAASAGTSVVSWTTREFPGLEGTDKAITELRDFGTFSEALAYLTMLGPGDHRIVGRDPGRSPIDLAAVTTLRRVYRTPADGSFQQGAVQVFETAVR